MTSTQQFTADATPESHPSVASAVFDNDEFCVVLFDERANRLHRLGSAASAVWMLCDGETSIGNLVDELVELLDLPRDTTASDVRLALNDFWSMGLLVGSPEPATRTESDGRDADRVLARPPDP